MSNTTTGSVGAIGSASGTPVSTSIYKIQGFKWVTKTPTAGDQCIVKDQNGNVIWQDFVPNPAPTPAGYIARDLFNYPLVVSGYAVTTLDSGMLLIFFVAT